MTEESADFRVPLDSEEEVSDAVSNDDGFAEEFGENSVAGGSIEENFTGVDFSASSEDTAGDVFDDRAVAQETTPSITLLQRLRRLFWTSKEERRQEVARRLQALDDAVVEFPKIAANYVYRGEIYLKTGDYALAAQDFERALTLADRHFADDRWGMVAQALKDRAQRGLVIARKRLI